MASSTHNFSPGVFDSFNARLLRPEEVASSFVVPEGPFIALSHRLHSILLGPRGSGKTTLLKMLQPQALDSWHGDDAERLRGGVSFIGIYVPSDITWHDQVESLTFDWLDANAKSVVATSAFTVQALLAFVQQLEYLVTARGMSDGSRQAEIVRGLAQAWAIVPEVPTLRSLATAMRNRARDLWMFASEERVRGNDGRKDRVADNTSLHLSLPVAMSAALEVIDREPELTGNCWAFLVDELEIAPHAVTDRLFSLLRSSDQRIIFKLAMAPYTGRGNLFESRWLGAEGHDYEIVHLTYGLKERGHDFSRRLLSQLLERRGLAEDIYTVFGRSEFDTDSDEWEEGSAYHKGSRRQRVIARLAIRDAAFAEFLRTHRIDPRTLKADGLERASILRKNLAAILFREDRLQGVDDSGNRPSLRSRKRSKGLYHGIPSLLSLSEGNPRTLLALGTTLLDRNTSARLPINASLQGSQIDRVIRRYRSYVAAVPVGTENAAVSILDRLDSIGEAFNRILYGPSFPVDLPNSFVVDAGCSSLDLDCFGRALNAGAIVFVPQGDESLVGPLVGKRFRLSYLLAAHHYLPLALGRSLNASRLLSEAESLRAARYTSPRSPSLF